MIKFTGVSSFRLNFRSIPSYLIIWPDPDSDLGAGWAYFGKRPYKGKPAWKMPRKASRTKWLSPKKSTVDWIKPGGIYIIVHHPLYKVYLGVIIKGPPSQKYQHFSYEQADQHVLFSWPFLFAASREAEMNESCWHKLWCQISFLQTWKWEMIQTWKHVIYPNLHPWSLTLSIIMEHNHGKSSEVCFGGLSRLIKTCWELIKMYVYDMFLDIKISTIYIHFIYIYIYIYT